MEGKVKFDFKSKMWTGETAGSWYFMSLPSEISKEIRANFQWQEEGWGRMKVVAKIKDLEWKTSIWFDSKLDIYVLPIKAEIRKRAEIKLNEVLDVCVWI
ncbi:DUF1905 domain-containing protein [Seonamhaeicola marinus]|uniref:DUF1905 domain-containing protein n=1 Tax=Seonamhaeicola marinus TaxID=1912246 RepID=A0A5D0HGQ4_9FLAO|nr:DUF1905 domain-containing protein [Seonamhaeicola marinus]TYA70120.1 DUF1905 domain-containing protein [Seonamhaeicola marinus]